MLFISHLSSSAQPQIYCLTLIKQLHWCLSAPIKMANTNLRYPQHCACTRSRSGLTVNVDKKMGMYKIEKKLKPLTTN